MASNVPSELSKLTVPQLKALCKERRITGYSKLSKAALLRKLAEVAAPTKTTTLSKSSNNQIDSQSASTVLSLSVGPANDVQSSADTPPCIESSSTRRAVNTVPPSASNTGSTETTSTTPGLFPTGLSKASQNHTPASSAQKLPSTKRPAHIDTSSPPKRIRTSSKAATTTDHGRSTSTSQTQALPVDSSVFKVPELPAHCKQPSHGSASTLARTTTGTSKPSVSRPITSGTGRFKPLVVSGLRSIEPDQVRKEPSSRAPKPFDSGLVPSSHATPLPTLANITLPPRASERNSVYRWAIILSAISPTDRRPCTLVSRAFRYAVYLSAVHILSRNYAGRRLDTILEQYSKNMTNFWPYLRLRMAQVSERRDAFKQSFLGRYTRSIGYDPLSEHLWSNPDDQKQVDVAIRFVLTRMWFAISVGTYGHDASTWSRCVIQDVREVVHGEVWQVIARDNRTGTSSSFYVLEATCEVIGQPPSSQDKDTLGYSLRADWTAWIVQQSRAPEDAGPPSLLDCVKWSNTEDYHQGISKAWLRRVHGGQDADDIAKKSIADKYVLASVVANGISGRWMSTSAMAQEFAGLPDRGDVHGARTAGRPANAVNMYLPAHHHVESVHFTTSNGDALHGAVAVVQTPGREYLVLRDNGMQVGCEEEGVPEVWQRMLGCDALGRAC